MDEQDLVDVGKLMFNNMEYKLSPDAEPALRECVCSLVCLLVRDGRVRWSLLGVCTRAGDSP